jgi:uncharacterized phiE125 gp8 family phage protein
MYADVFEDDELLEEIITSAREYVEEVTNRAILTQEWEYYLDRFPTENYIRVPFGNLQSAVVKYTDSDGTETTMTSGTDYILETNGEAIGRIVLPNNVSWPSTVLYSSNPIVIEFECGWSDADDVPRKIVTAIKMVATDLYENRETQSERQYYQNKTVDNLLASLRLWGNFK